MLCPCPAGDRHGDRIGHAQLMADRTQKDGRYFAGIDAGHVALADVRLCALALGYGEADRAGIVTGGFLDLEPLVIVRAMTRQARYNPFQLINSFYEYRSIILTTNKDFTSWGEFFHDDNVAVPIIDRIIHHSHIFMLGGESYRLKQKTTG